MLPFIGLVGWGACKYQYIREWALTIVITFAIVLFGVGLFSLINH